MNLINVEVAAIEYSLLEKDDMLCLATLYVQHLMRMADDLDCLDKSYLEELENKLLKEQYYGND